MATSSARVGSGASCSLPRCCALCHSDSSGACAREAVSTAALGCNSAAIAQAMHTWDPALTLRTRRSPHLLLLRLGLWAVVLLQRLLHEPNQLVCAPLRACSPGAGGVSREWYEVGGCRGRPWQQAAQGRKPGTPSGCLASKHQQTARAPGPHLAALRSLCSQGLELPHKRPDDVLFTRELLLLHWLQAQLSECLAWVCIAWWVPGVRHAGVCVCVWSAKHRPGVQHGGVRGRGGRTSRAALQPRGLKRPRTGGAGWSAASPAHLRRARRPRAIQPRAPPSPHLDRSGRTRQHCVRGRVARMLRLHAAHGRTHAHARTLEHSHA